MVSLKLEGGIKDYELPEINEDVPGDLLGAPATSTVEDQKKYNDLIKEQELIKEEHKSNIKELNTKIEELELQLKLKSDKALEL